MLSHSPHIAPITRYHYCLSYFPLLPVVHRQHRCLTLLRVLMIRLAVIQIAFSLMLHLYCEYVECLSANVVQYNLRLLTTVLMCVFAILHFSYFELFVHIRAYVITTHFLLFHLLNLHWSVEYTYNYCTTIENHIKKM
jgi:hypothetical protein